MKVSKALITLSSVLLWSGPAFAQDPAKVDSGHYKVVVDNPSVRVLKIDYAAGEKSPMHQHPDAIVVPLAATKVKFTMPDGKSQERDLANEAAEYMPGGPHSPENVGTGKVDALLIEFKAAAPGTAALPSTREGLGMKMLAEGPRAVAYRTSADPTFQEPAGTKHDYDQVVIALSDAKMSLSIDGKPAKTSWTRGDVQFIGRGVAHESKNETGKPIDFVIVAVR
jgi:quercetin dioxygenase-like cupin family protein